MVLLGLVALDAVAQEGGSKKAQGEAGRYTQGMRLQAVHMQCKVFVLPKPYFLMPIPQLMLTHGLNDAYVRLGHPPSGRRNERNNP